MSEHTHIYYYRNRPPGLFVQPDGFNPDTRQSFKPRKSFDTPIGGRAFLGVVEYPEALHPKQVYDFELWPENEVEWAKYQVYDRMRNTQDHGLLSLYMNYAKHIESSPDDPDLIGNPTAIIVAILLSANVNIEDLPGDWW